MRIEPIPCFWRHVQSKLGPSEEDVLERARPLVGDEVIDLARMKPGTEMLAEIGSRSRTLEQSFGSGAVSARKPMD